MTYDFTPAASRVLQAAQQAANVPGDDQKFLLMALAAESESRAAVMLAQRGVDPSKIQRRWPDIANSATKTNGADGTANLGQRPQPEVIAALDRIEPVLAELPRPLAISTEHLLLAVLDSSSEVGKWLAEQGVAFEEIRDEIFRLHGVRLGPIDSGISIDDRPVVPSMPLNVNATKHLRILDASANRATEALRVIEDFLRFGLDDAHLSSLAKQLRHDLAAALGELPPVSRFAARDTLGDVGTSINTDSEYQRTTATDIVEANFARLQQSLRSMEEFAKIDFPHVAQLLEQLRYRSYTLHRAVGITCDSGQRLVDARLYVLIDGQANEDAFSRLARSVAEAGADIVQLRDKSLDDRALLARARMLRQITSGTNTLFIMNDRPDLAELSDADGVHVGQEELSVRDARQIIGCNRIVGVSTHNIEQARQAVLDGANYIGVGPTFASRTKLFDEFAGLDFVSQVAREIKLPAFAIGGIDTTNAQQVLEAGIARVAVGAAITRASDPTKEIVALLKILRRREGVPSDNIGETEFT